MAKRRVHELAKELQVESKDIISYMSDTQKKVLKPMSALDEEDELALRRHFATGNARKEGYMEKENLGQSQNKDMENEKKQKTAQNTPAGHAAAAGKAAGGKSTAATDGKAAAAGKAAGGKSAAATDGKAAAPGKKKKNISVVFNNSFGGKGGKRHNGKPGAAGERNNGGQGTSRPRPKRVSRRLQESAAADREREEARRRARQEEEARQREKESQAAAAQKAKETAAQPKEEAAPAAEEKAAPKRIVRENVFDQMRKKEAEKAAKAAAAKKNEGSRERGGNRDSRGGRGGNGRREGSFEHRNNAGGRSSQPHGARNAAASMPAPSEGRPSRKGQDNRRNGEHSEYKRDKRKGSRLDKSERTFTLEKQSAHKKQHKQPQPKPQQDPDAIRTITLPEQMMLKELADIIKVPAADLVKKLFMQGKMVTVNQESTYDEAEEIALEYNCIAEPEKKVDVIAELLKEDEEDPKDLKPRPPVVCVMGHVDHGKTSLLDAIRHTHSIEKEAGGITQAIGAYVVEIGGRKITFLDTPGHEAFTAMRMRGANSTDIAVLVVAADDGVMPQTVEAINHAKAAGIEIIVAVNKIDKPGANVERVKQELSEYELIPEDWGGTTIFVPVSAKTGEGISDLLEMILLTADVMELKANPNRQARGLVIEAKLDKGKGVCATVLVQKGTLHVGDAIAAGSSYGKVRAMTDENGRRVKEAGPSIPVEVQGLSEVPGAGEIFVSPETEKEARSFAETFIEEEKKKLVSETRSHMTLDDLFSQIQSGNVKELELIVKADVQGSVEALKQSLEKLSNDEVVVKIIHSGVGAINESDVVLATASNAVIIGFNVRPDAAAKTTADSEGVQIKLYNVIYNAIEDVQSAMTGMLEPVYEEKVTGHVEVRQIFKASGVGNIAGSYVTDGVVKRDSNVRVIRDGKTLFDGKIASLKRFQDDVKEAKSGFECGIVLDGFDQFQEGDQLEAYSMVEVPRDKVAADKQKKAEKA